MSISLYNFLVPVSLDHISYKREIFKYRGNVSTGIAQMQKRYLRFFLLFLSCFYVFLRFYFILNIFITVMVMRFFSYVTPLSCTHVHAQCLHVFGFDECLRFLNFL